jgi:hypothetical protein
MSEGDERALLLKQIRDDLDRIQPIKFGSIGEGSGVRHIRRKNPGL